MTRKEMQTRYKNLMRSPATTAEQKILLRELSKASGGFQDTELVLGMESDKEYKFYFNPTAETKPAKAKPAKAKPAKAKPAKAAKKTKAVVAIRKPKKTSTKATKTKTPSKRVLAAKERAKKIVADARERAKTKKFVSKTKAVAYENVIGKTALTKNIAKEANITQGQAKKAVEHIEHVVKHEVLGKGKTLRMQGIVSLKGTKNKSRKYSFTNPKTGKNYSGTTKQSNRLSAKVSKKSK